eukprot:2964237-Rhodomonas_salina.1
MGGRRRQAAAVMIGEKGVLEGHHPGLATRVVSRWAGWRHCLGWWVTLVSEKKQVAAAAAGDRPQRPTAHPMAGKKIRGRAQGLSTSDLKTCDLALLRSR